MDDLQFQKAEFSSNIPSCAVCKTDLTGDHYRLLLPAKPAPRLVDLCPNCAAKLREVQRPPDNAAFGRGLLYGAGMAILCGIGYGVMILATGMQIGLVAIVVGYLVGRAFRTGTGGRGGRRCQIAAVTLTYLAMTLSYAPVILKQLRDSRAQQEATEQQSKLPTSAPAAGTRPLGVDQYALGFVLLAGISLASPFLDVLSGFSGIIGLAIIVFGLRQAWVLTAGDRRILTGPFSRTPTALLSAGDPTLV